MGSGSSTVAYHKNSNVDTSRISPDDKSFCDDLNLQRLNKFKILCFRKISQVSSIHMLLKTPSFMLAFTKFLSADFKYYNQLTLAEIRIIKGHAICLNLSTESTDELSKLNKYLCCVEDIVLKDTEKTKTKQLKNDDALMVMIVLKFLQSFRCSIHYSIWKEGLSSSDEYLEISLCWVLEFNPWSEQQHEFQMPYLNVYSKALQNIDTKYYKSLVGNTYVKQLIGEVESLPIGVSIHAVDEDSIETAYANEAYRRITGATNQEIFKMDFAYLHGTSSYPNTYQYDSYGKMRQLVSTKQRDNGDEYEELVGTKIITNLHDDQKFMIALHMDVSLGMDKEKYKLLIYDLLTMVPESVK